MLAPPATARRQRLLEDLLQLFLAEGFLHFTMDEIAERLRCSKKTLYQLASSRDDLFVRVIERWLGDLRSDGWKAAQRSTDRLEAIQAYMNAALPALRRASSGFDRDLLRWPRGRACLQKHQRQRADGLARLLEDSAFDDGVRVPHARLLAELMLAAAQRLADPDFLASMNLSMSKGFEIFYRAIQYGLLPPADKRRTERRAATSRRNPR